QAYVYDLPADYYQTYASRVAAVTAEDVKRAADQYIQPERFAVVIVGDRKAIEAGVRSLNLGPVTVLEPAEIFKGRATGDAGDVDVSEIRGVPAIQAGGAGPGAGVGSSPFPPPRNPHGTRPAGNPRRA